jgi:hypothetical protein
MMLICHCNPLPLLLNGGPDPIHRDAAASAAELLTGVVATL